MASITAGTLSGAQLPRVRVAQASQLPLPPQIAAHASRRAQLQPPASRLTWSFAFCAMFAMGSFFIAHVLLSSWLISEESLLERGKLTNFRKQQLLNFQKSSMANNADAGGMKRILVLGSHHTGTSIITKLIMESGAFAGDDLVMLPGNNLKYNEYRPAVEADKLVMSRGHGAVNFGPRWVDYGYSWDKVSAADKQVFLKAVDKVIHDLDTGTAANKKRAWVLKDPRMSILAEHWVGQSSNSICVIVVRNPIEASIRLAKVYNRGPGQSLSVPEWIEFWTQSMINAGRACLKYRRKVVFASHAELMQDPFAFARSLEKELFGENRRFAEPKDVYQILGENFGLKGKVEDSESPDDPINQLLWSPDVLKTWKALVAKDLALLPAPSPMSRIVREAYATIVTGNNKAFVAGALALARSIRQFDNNRDLIAMISVEVTDDTVKEALTTAGWRTVQVKKLEEPWYETHEKCRSFSESQKVRWGRMFSKLRVYSLPYERVVYLDTDAIVLRDISDYFSLPNDFYGERSPSHNGINAGIMVLRPSEVVLSKLIQYAKEHEPMEFWKRNQVGCTEQELLNRFWDGANPDHKLNNTRHFDYLSDAFINAPGRDDNRLNGPRIAHCLTTKCPKPWDTPLSKLMTTSPDFSIHYLPSHCDRLIYLEWYRVYLSHELEAARAALLKGTADSEAPALHLGKEVALKDVEAELLAIAGPGKVNFKRNWASSQEEGVQMTTRDMAAEIRRKQGSVFLPSIRH